MNKNADDLKKLRGLKVAIVHDWLIGGGAERVVAELHRMFPDAPIYTSYCSDEWRKRLDGKVVTGFLQRWPFGKLRKFVGVLRIWWFGRLNLRGYDVVISSTGNGEAFGINVPKGTIHICYCHSPTHYYWRHYDTYMKHPGLGMFDPLARLGLRLLLGPLRAWDLRTSKRPDHFIANSTHIQRDIKNYYRRESTVVYPPIDIGRFERAPQGKRRGFVAMGRQVPAKRLDIIVKACARMGLPLTVIGNGPEHERLVQMAGPTVEFLTDVTDAEMPALLAGAKAFLFASFDDFGIAPVEALAAGTPVIAYKAGGALDYIQPGKTGLFFSEQTVESLMEAIQGFDSSRFDAKEIQKYARQYAPDVFEKHMAALISELLDR